MNPAGRYGWSKMHYLIKIFLFFGKKEYLCNPILVRTELKITKN